MKERFTLKEVAEMLDIGPHRIDYAERHHQIPVKRPHRYAHHWYTWDEIKAVADWFGVPMPQQKEINK